MGLSLRTRLRTRKVWASEAQDPPPPHKPGRPHWKVTQRTLNITYRQQEVHSGITSWEIKEKNPCLLAGVWNLEVQELQDCVYTKGNHAHHVKRLAFAANYREWSLEEWPRVLFSNVIWGDWWSRRKGLPPWQWPLRAPIHKKCGQTTWLAHGIRLFFLPWCQQTSVLTQEPSH